MIRLTKSLSREQVLRPLGKCMGKFQEQEAAKCQSLFTEPYEYQKPSTPGLSRGR